MKLHTKAVLAGLMILGAAASASAKDEFSKDTMKKMEVFVSNFTECFFNNTTREEMTADNEKLVNFAMCHLNVNAWKSSYIPLPECLNSQKGMCAYGQFKVSSDKVARVIKKYLDYDMKKFASTEYYHYEKGFFYAHGADGEQPVRQEQVHIPEESGKGWQGIGITGIAERFSAFLNPEGYSRDRMAGFPDMDIAGADGNGAAGRNIREPEAGNGRHDLPQGGGFIDRCINRQLRSAFPKAHCLKPVHQHRNIRGMVKMPVGQEQRIHGFRRGERSEAGQYAAAQVQLDQCAVRLQQVSGGGAAAFRERTVDSQQMQFHMLITPLPSRCYPQPLRRSDPAHG